MVAAITKVELYGHNSSGDIRRFTVADGKAIAKGTMLELQDPRTASGGKTEVVAGSVIAGISSEAKEASDGQTSIGCWTNGIFEIVSSGAISAGQAVGCGGENSVKYDVNFSGASVIGTALETAAAAGETINIRVSL